MKVKFVIEGTKDELAKVGSVLPNGVKVETVVVSETTQSEEMAQLELFSSLDREQRRVAR
jgi:hypothetical protein